MTQLLNADAIRGPKVGDVRVCKPEDYASGQIMVEEFSYHGEASPFWAVPAWEERGLSELSGPFATTDDAIYAIREVLEEHRAESEANKRLIAAAPDLLEALKWMVENDDTNQGDEPVDGHGGLSWNEINAYWIEGLNRAKAAIRKATEG